jgi:hypothetical protein
MVPASPRHVNRIAKRMREIDVLECAAMGHTPKVALRMALLASTMAWTVMIDGEPEGMLGVTPVNVMEGKGCPWLLLTDKGGAQRKALMRLGRIYTGHMHRHFSLLENWVHADNARTIRWLTRLGYAVGGVDVIRGHRMRPFVRQQ